MRVAIAGSSGTIGAATQSALVSAGMDVVALTRDDFSDVEKLRQRLVGCRAVLSCIASRKGTHSDAWAVDHLTNKALLNAALDAGATRFVLLSAICVQKPKLAFQNAKLAFEAYLRASGADWTIVRPTAFFKSLSGQVARVQAGKRFLVFGNGTLTACKPISDRDLAGFLVTALSNPKTIHQTLAIGGPGPALTPLDQVALLSNLLSTDIKTRHVPLQMMNGIIALLDLFSIFSDRLRDRAEFARIGRYYATESMLHWNAEQQVYDADATPEFGSDTLRDHYADLIAGRITHNAGDHAAF